jgi:hypothetical protein
VGKKWLKLLFFDVEIEELITFGETMESVEMPMSFYK